MKRGHSMPFGAEVINEGEVRFNFWAPQAATVELCLHDSPQTRRLPMVRTSDGWYRLNTDHARHGSLYSFRINGDRSVPDPASRFQPEDVHGPSQVIDPNITDWSDGDWLGRPWEEAVIYELHLGTFTPSGTFRGARERLDYLAELGITAIELMPVADFPGGRSWGYDGVLPFAPDHNYGRPEDFKDLVQAAHERGIMVFLDVVYNHFGPDGNYLYLYAPEFFTAEHQTPWGDAINFDGPGSAEVRTFFIHNALYWLEEYHLDGLRLDAVHAIYDNSRPDVLEELADRVQQGPGKHRHIHLVLENDNNAAHYLDGHPDLDHAGYSAQWNDDSHHCLHTLLTGETDGYYADYADHPILHLGRCLTEGFAWQGEPSPYRDNRPRGEPSASLPLSAFISFSQNHDQVGNRALGDRIDALADPAAVTATVVLRLLSPSPTLLFMGEEYGATTPFQFFCDFPGELGKKVTEGRRREFARFSRFSSRDAIPDPNDPETFLASKLDWSHSQNPDSFTRRQLFQELIALRRQVITPALDSGKKMPASFRHLSNNAVEVFWTLRDGSQLSMLINLGHNQITVGSDVEPAGLIYALPLDLPESIASGFLPPWSIAVRLQPGANTSASRQATIAELHNRARIRSHYPAADSTRAGEGSDSIATIPAATYRLQLHREFSFRDATRILPYLNALGISHVYCSPYLKARPGSTHGYDIVDHRELNPEIGSVADLENFVAELKRLSMGHILDMVPNHMGVMGSDNPWWLNVLENGPASPYGDFFDIDWTPSEPRMLNKVLLPVLGDHYGHILDQHQLQLEFRDEQGSFVVTYYEHEFPVDPQTYPFILSGESTRDQPSDQKANPPPALETLLSAFENLPHRNTLADDERIARDRNKTRLQQELLRCYQENPSVAEHIRQCLARFNEAEGDTGINLLHQLLERQAYRLAYWRVASDEINYRRFFDINDLACLRMEEPKVFEATHKLVLDLIAGGKVTGLRIDHPDGLHDPAQYFRRLQNRILEETTPEKVTTVKKAVYLIAEKILAQGDQSSHGEELRRDWPIHGTTGYDFSALCTGLFVANQNAAAMQRIYEEFIGEQCRLADVRYSARKLIMQTSLASEIRVLATQLYRISDASRYTRDYTLNGLRQALVEVIACFPVYRTYITPEGIAPDDRKCIDRAIAEGARRSRAADVTAFDFIRDVLLLRLGEDQDERYRKRLIRFCMQLQQYTAPVMAKGVEDTTFYVYNRLLALNEVGADPAQFGLTVTQFHDANRRRLAHWPHNMLATSTHDSKRSADVRARICVLSEIPRQWQKHVMRWGKINQGLKTRHNDMAWPDSNAEYLFYQTLVGVWPLQPMEAAARDDLQTRVRHYMLKAVKEAKQHTSWVNTNVEYERCLSQFVDHVLDVDNRDFLEDFLPFQRHVSRLGLINSLAQTLLKLTSPGVPDTYQGDELWNFSMVDPDNRRPVGYEQRNALLEDLEERFVDNDRLLEEVDALTEHMADGKIKCYLIWKSLGFRRNHQQLFLNGDYVPLETRGSRAHHLCAFARKGDNSTLIVVVPRLLGSAEGLNPMSDNMPFGKTFWSDTEVTLPASVSRNIDAFRNVLTGQECIVEMTSDSAFVCIAELLDKFPVALLHANTR